MSQKIGQIRQGDILLVPVNDIPPENAITTSRLVLAEGELTGHAHVLTAQSIVTWGDLLRVVGPENGELYHEDHDPKPVGVVVGGQTYRVVRQREYTLSGMWQKVRD